MKAIGVIGYHHTGKTTLVCALIKELTARGYKVVSIQRHPQRRLPQRYRGQKYLAAYQSW